MYEKLEKLITEGDYREALYEFQDAFMDIDSQSNADAARLCVLEASLWENLGDSYSEFMAISRGLSYQQDNYELFYMLGLYYRSININQAYLCMEMALHYCDASEDRGVILDAVRELENDGAMRVRKTSIMVLSYNDLELIKMCIEAIEDYQPEGSYEIVVVDNDSDEAGVCEYLRGKRDEVSYTFKLIESDENLGFPKGCNLGAANCDSGNDIFFLNNDAVLTPNALFWLRMGLYDNRNVGACSALSNSASLQELSPSEFESYAGHELSENWHKEMSPADSYRIFKEYASMRSVPLHNPYTRQFRLTGFALLVSRDALNVVAVDGKVFDELFSPGYFEDDDLGIRIARAGFTQYLCGNSYIYHNGGSGFAGHSDAMEKGKKKFEEKWGFDVWGFCLPWDEAVIKVAALYEDKKEPLRVIDFTCGFGATGAYLKHKIPDIYVAGVCGDPFSASIAKNLVDDVTWGELNTTRLPWKDHSFDIAIIEKEYVCKPRASQYIKKDGIIIDDSNEGEGANL